MYRATAAEKKIPGYTGYQPQEDQDEGDNASHASDSQVPGYGGFIPGVGAENVHGKTYGSTTNMSITGKIPRGTDPAPEYRYTSTHHDSYMSTGIERGYIPKMRILEEEDPTVPDVVAHKFYAGK